MADPQAEKQTYGAFERLLYIFLIPLIFVTILLGVLLSLFDYDVMNSLLKVANKIPGIERVIPDPKGTAEPSPGTRSPSLPQEGAATVEPDDLDAQMLALEADLKQAVESGAAKDNAIKALQEQVAALEEQLKEKTQGDEEYQERIRSLASVYAKMQPSKAAPILENLTLHEQVLVLSEMKPDEQVRILEKMAPARAAEASIALKDAIPGKDLQIAALQERLELNSAAAAPPAETVTRQQLGQTFAGMTPKSAAAILIEMNGVNSPKVLSILGAMDSASRAKVLSAIADADRNIAVSLSARLAE